MTTPKAKSPPVVSVVPADLAARFKDFPGLQILERRLLDPHDPGTSPILLKDEPDRCCQDIGHAMKAKVGALRCQLCRVPFRLWYIRWINAGQDERWATVRGRGYVKVLVRELADAEDYSKLTGIPLDDPVTRGERKLEVLAKIPFPYFIEIRRRKEDEIRKRRRPGTVKDEIVKAAEQEFGDEGAQTLHDSLKVEEVSKHRSTLQREVEGSETDA